MLNNYSPPTDPFLDILYRDNDIVVCNKPSGLLSVKGRAPEHRDSLQSRAQNVWPTLGVVHRLDMVTSGIMLMALNKAALRDLSRQFQNRQTQKIYIADIWGIPKTQQGEIDLPLICDWPNRPRQKVCFESGKPSLTRWKLISSNANSSRVELYPITGRSHQLRVHLAEIGHPILGDEFYAHSEAFNAASRLRLHAAELGFTHPVTQKAMKFESKPAF